MRIIHGKCQNNTNKNGRLRDQQLKYMYRYNVHVSLIKFQIGSSNRKMCAFNAKWKKSLEDSMDKNYKNFCGS